MPALRAITPPHVRRNLLLLASSALGACSQPAPTVHLDLAQALPAATLTAPRELVLFGSAAGLASQLSGFIPAAPEPGGDTRVWVQPRCEIKFVWSRREPRVAAFDMAPYPDVRTQAALVLLNGHVVGQEPLEQHRRRYRFVLPVEAQREGHNVLRLEFAQGTERVAPHRERLAAALYSVAVAPPSDPALEDLTVQDAPPPLSASGAPENRRLFQVGPGSIGFALRVPESAELRFTPEVHPAAHRAGAVLQFRVSLTEETLPTRELWSTTLAARTAAAGEVRIRIPIAPGKLARINLGLEAVGERFAWGVWKNPRLLGRGARDPVVDAPVATATPEQPREAEGKVVQPGLNVVLVILDAAGARHFPAYGYHRPTTPEFDRLVSEGVLFEQARTPASFTLLAMGALWTSRPPDEHHSGLAYNAPLPETPLTLAELLSGAGIRTAGFIANGVAGPAFGLQRGFEHFEEVFREHGSFAEAFRKVLPDWLARHRSQRFFLYVHFREPHFAYNPPPPFDTLFGPEGPLPRRARTHYDWITDVNWKRTKPSAEELAHLGRLYDGNLAYVDRELGALRRALEKEGLLERTVVIVTADHGDALYEHDFIGHLDQVYEEILAIPLVMRFPGADAPRGQRVIGQVDLLDLAPTVADIFNLDLDPGRDLGLGPRAARRDAFQGRSLLPMLAGAPGKAVVFSRSAGAQPKYALRHGRFKYIFNTARASDELYDIEADPRERQNLATAHALRTTYYRQVVQRRWLKLRSAGPAGTAPARLTAEQKENLRALGYVN